MKNYIPILWIALVLFTASCWSGKARKQTDALTVSLQEKPLADWLPDSTILYSQLNISKFLQSVTNHLTYIDPEYKREVSTQTLEILHQVKTLLATYQFTPKLLDFIQDVRVHIILLPTENKTPPKSGPSTPTPWFVIESKPMLTLDCFEQIKYYFESKSHENPEWKLSYQDNSLDIRSNTESFTIYHKGPYLIIGFDSVPLNFLDRLPQKNLTSTKHYKTFADKDAAAFYVLNLSGLIQKAIDRKNRDSYDTVHGSFNLAELFSLNQLSSSGGKFICDTDQNKSMCNATLGLAHEQPISVSLSQLFNGGRNFELPKQQLDLGLGIMFRLGISDIYSQIIGKLDSQRLQSLQVASNMSKQMMGYTLDELIGLISGDFYLFADTKEGALDRAIRWLKQDRHKSKHPFNEIEFVALMGISERNMVIDLIDKTHLILSNIFKGSITLEKLEIENQAMYLISQQINSVNTGSESKIDFAVAVAVIDRHLAIGSPKTVKSLLQTQNLPAKKETNIYKQALIDRPNSNLLVLLSDKLLKRIEKFQISEKEQRKNKKLLIDALSIPEAEQKFGQLIESIVKLEFIHRKYTTRETDLFSNRFLLSADHRKNIYEIKIESGKASKK